MFYDCFLLLWEQNQSGISRPQLQCSEVSALLTSISKRKLHISQITYYSAFARFEIGVGVFVGWGGSTLLVVGGLIYSIFAGREGCHSRWNPKIYQSFIHLHRKVLFLQSELYSTKRLPVCQVPAAYMAVPSRKSIASIPPTEISRKSGISPSDGDGNGSGSRVNSMSGTTTSMKTTASFEYVWAGWYLAQYRLKEFWF